MIRVPRWQSGFALLVGLGIVISAVTHLVIAAPKLAQSKFTDIQGSWSQSCITQLASKGIISGYPDGTFRPNSSVTRSEFAAMVNKAFPTAKKTRNSVEFVDVPSNYWAYNAIETATQTGFLSGYPGKVFNPSQNISRAQALVALASGLNYSPTQFATTTLNTNFSDAKTIPGYAYTGIAAATEKNLVVNYPDVKSLKPNKLASRAEVSAFLCQALAGSSEQASGIPEQYIAGRTSSKSKYYYVDIKGSDKAKGTQSSPWRTLNKAFASVPPDQGYTIQIGAGTFDIGKKVSVPSGVNLVGSGVNSTTLTGELRLVGVKNITISRMKFDGKNRAYELGMYILDANKLTIHDLAFNGYANTAIDMDRVSGSNVYNITITDSSQNNRIAGGGGKQSHAFGIGNLTNVNLHDMNIDTRKRGGGGMRTISEDWVGKPSGSKFKEGDLRNVKFYNLDIKVDKWNAWGSGYTPQMALELWHQNCYNCEIYNSTFNSTLSLASPANKKPTSIHAHHNLWYGPDNPLYACEVSSNNIEFDHNYIRGGAYPLASFGIKFQNLNVHHNIFEKTGGPTVVGHFREKRDNFKFTNNTVYAKNSKDPFFRLFKGDGENQEIRNNIFYNSSDEINNSLGASAGVANNIFYNIKPTGSQAINLDPKFKLSGALPSPYYMPNSGSKTVNFGAIKTGDPVWIVGKKTSGNG